MKIRPLTFFLVVLLSGSLSQSLAQEKNDSDEARVKETVMRYLEAWKNQDEVSMKAALHPEARLYQKIEGDRVIYQASGRRIISNVRRSSRLEGGDLRNVKIVWADTAGEAASAKVEILYPDSYLSTGKTSLLVKPPPGVLETRYLSLLKLVDGWKIVSDIYQIRENTQQETAQR
jgi:hypothetical protein